MVAVDGVYVYVRVEGVLVLSVPVDVYVVVYVCVTVIVSVYVCVYVEDGDCVLTVLDDVGVYV